MAEESGSEERKPLTLKQKAFIEEYFVDFNGVQAAERAGYGGDYWTLAAIASENLKKPKIAARIKERFQARCMTADEALARLADQGRADVADYVDEVGYLDWDKLQADGKTHLIKKYKVTRLATGKLRVEIELHDAQRALELIGKHHGLFVERSDIMKSIDLSKLTVAQLERIRDGEDVIAVLASPDA